jgi:hypothetical protein
MDMSRYIYNDELAAASGRAHPPITEPIPGLPIPRKSKAFLTNVGLPERFVEFTLDYNRTGLVRLDVYVEWWRQIEKVAFAKTCHRLAREPEMWRYFVLPHPVHLSHYYRVGEMDIGMTLCIEKHSGNVYSIDIAGLDGYSPSVFINSDITTFGRFVTVYKTTKDHDRDTLRSRLTAMDPKAMEDADQGFWPLMIEEFEAGLS